MSSKLYFTFGALLAGVFSACAYGLENRNSGSIGRYLLPAPSYDYDYDFGPRRGAPDYGFGVDGAYDNDDYDDYYERYQNPKGLSDGYQGYPIPKGLRAHGVADEEDIPSSTKGAMPSGQGNFLKSMPTGAPSREDDIVGDIASDISRLNSEIVGTIAASSGMSSIEHGGPTSASATPTETKSLKSSEAVSTPTPTPTAKSTGEAGGTSTGGKEEPGSAGASGVDEAGASMVLTQFGVLATAFLTVIAFLW
ncbi:hypothetical protein RUND412_007092 [Rhizina undulata]